MSELPGHCTPCKQGTPPLSEAAARELAPQVPHWTLDYPHLRRRFRLRDFRRALAWVNRVGMLAEEEGHHPDFHLTAWREVELVLTTHVAGGPTENDFVLAKRIDALAERDGLGA